MTLLGLVSILEFTYLCIKFKCGREIKQLLTIYTYDEIIERTLIDLEKAKLENIKPNLSNQLLAIHTMPHKARKI